MIFTKKLKLHYAGTNLYALDGVDLIVEQESVVLLLGKSGCGKTSLLRCLAGLAHHSGTIELGGQPIHALKAHERASLVGFVAQGLNLFPHLTVLDNCIQPQQKVLKKGKKEAKMNAKKLLEKFGIESLAYRFPHELSGGQQQRVAIIRTLGMDAKILLMDEPSSALDPDNLRQLQAFIRELKKEGLTIVLSTHDLSFVKGIADTAHYMEKGKVIKSVALNENLQGVDQMLKLYYGEKE